MRCRWRNSEKKERYYHSLNRALNTQLLLLLLSLPPPSLLLLLLLLLSISVMAKCNEGMIEWLTKPIISSFFINLNVLTYSKVCVTVSSFLLYPHLLNNNRTHKPKTVRFYSFALPKRRNWTANVFENILLKCECECAYTPLTLVAFLYRFRHQLRSTITNIMAIVITIISLNIFMTIFIQHIHSHIYIYINRELCSSELWQSLAMPIIKKS